MRAIDFECNIGQMFGGNANPLYAGQGLKGHPGTDENCGYGTDIHSYVNGLVYSLYPVNAPAQDGYTAIFTLVETALETFEFTEGHVSRIDAKIGDYITKGLVIGAEGNHGEVYQGGVRITLAMQAAGDRRGTHRHVQKRPCIKVLRTDPKKMYLQTAQGIYRDNEGYYYEIYDYNNGYNGCVDLMAPMFPRDLWWGVRGYDVYLFQKVLVRNGLFDPKNCTGYFGGMTNSAAIQFQKKFGIYPQLGYIGPKTRAILNIQFSQI